MRLLLIEDDPSLGAALKSHLEADGHRVDWAVRLLEAEAYLSTSAYEILLLDLMLPDGRGVPFLRTRRAAGLTTPVIILTARDQISDRIEGLNAGADDYLVKPFDLDELSARIHAVGRRLHGLRDPVMTVGEVAIEPAARRVARAGRTVELTAREWGLLEALAARPGQILSKSALEDRLYSLDTEVESNAIEVHVSRLRRKLGRDLIETVRGLGYRLATP